MNFYVITKKSFLKALVFLFFIFAAFIWYSFQGKITPAFQAVQSDEVREIHMITGEFKSKMDDGKELEVYQFLPGTIYLSKGEKVHLKILGVNGEEHPFTIEGTDIQGTVKKGQETVVPLQFNEEGTYRLICVTHADKQHEGPMIAYIVVD